MDKLKSAYGGLVVILVREMDVPKLPPSVQLTTSGGSDEVVGKVVKTLQLEPVGTAQSTAIPEGVEESEEKLLQPLAVVAPDNCIATTDDP